VWQKKNRGSHSDDDLPEERAVDSRGVQIFGTGLKSERLDKVLVGTAGAHGTVGHCHGGQWVCEHCRRRRARVG
jgi:hypothetical protein